RGAAGGRRPRDRGSRRASPRRPGDPPSRRDHAARRGRDALSPASGDAPEFRPNMVALILLPGMDGTAKLREEFVAALGPTIEATAIPCPTEQPLGYPELESLVRSSLPVDRPYVLLGESFSGPIAISIAGSCPPGLRAIVLCGSFVRNPRPILGSLGWLL